MGVPRNCGVASSIPPTPTPRALPGPSPCEPNIDRRRCPGAVGSLTGRLSGRATAAPGGGQRADSGGPHSVDKPHSGAHSTERTSDGLSRDRRRRPDDPCALRQLDGVGGGLVLVAGSATPDPIRERVVQAVGSACSVVDGGLPPPLFTLVNAVVGAQTTRQLALASAVRAAAVAGAVIVVFRLADAYEATLSQVEGQADTAFRHVVDEGRWPTTGLPSVLAWRATGASGRPAPSARPAMSFRLHPCAPLDLTGSGPAVSGWGCPRSPRSCCLWPVGSGQP